MWNEREKRDIQETFGTLRGAFWHGSELSNWMNWQHRFTDSLPRDDANKGGCLDTNAEEAKEISIPQLCVK